MARLLKDWIGGYLQYTEASAAAASYHYWTAVSCIAGTLRRQVWLDELVFELTPNFYIVLCGPPGVLKSSAISQGMALLRQVTGINFGPDNFSWQALIDVMENSRFDMAMADGTFLPMSCIQLCPSELGTMLNMQEGQMIDVMVDLWDGHKRPWTKATRVQKSNAVENPWINLITATTPDWIAGNFNETVLGGGFISRCIFVYAEEDQHIRGLPSLYAESTKKKDLESKLVADLQEMAATMRGEFRYTAEAGEWYDKIWYPAHKKESRDKSAFLQMTGFLARKPGHVLKLAMILSASRDSSRVIQLADFQRAVQIIGELEKDMPKAFSKLRLGHSHGPMAFSYPLLARVATSGGLPLAQLFREMFVAYRMSKRDFEAIIQSAVEAQEIHLRTKGGVPYIWPGPAYHLRGVVTSGNAADISAKG